MTKLPSKHKLKAKGIEGTPIKCGKCSICKQPIWSNQDSEYFPYSLGHCHTGCVWNEEER